MTTIVHLILNALSIFIAAKIVPGIFIKDLFSALMVALALGIINTYVKPILKIFTLPLTIITLGLFSIVLNVLLIMLADYFIKGFTISGFYSALLFSITFSIINYALNYIVKD